MKRLAALPIVAFVLLLMGTGIASAQPQTHTVVRGDTLWALSQEFHTTVQALATENGIPNPNLIFVGQVLTIDPAVITPPTTPLAVAPPSPLTGSSPLPLEHPLRWPLVACGAASSGVSRVATRRP